jgi:hypothetical protein
MALGYDREQNIVNLGDTAELFAYLYDQRTTDPVPEDELTAVSFKIQKPDKSEATQAGTINDEGAGTTLYNDTDLIGQYIAVATFTDSDGKLRSTRCDFEVIDPFAEISPSATWFLADAAWRKIEDCFDGEDEGPWLKEMTLNYFNKEKMESFIAEAMFDINQQNPPTSLAVSNFIHDDGTNTNTFVATADLPLAAQGVFICVLRHLIRSYVEQPNPVGAQIAWHDRRDYLQRWQSVLQVELTQYQRMLALYKRQFLGLGQTRVLVASKAGRLIPAPLRTRNVGRGYW